MVVPLAMAQTCPQCGADVRASGARCQSCGFWLPSTPAPRTGPPQARPSSPVDESGRTLALVLTLGGVVVLGLVGVGVMVWLRRGDAEATAHPTPVTTAAPAVSAAPVRLEPSRLLADARRQASAWHRDAVLVSLSAKPLDAHGVEVGGTVELVYAKPAGSSVAGGADAGVQRLTLRSSGDALTSNEDRGGKGKIAPEPNCLFEDAWAAAQRAGADASAGLGLRYGWSDKQGRPVWEVVTSDGQVQRRLDGVSCSILTR